jgi:SAM-dependent methyltransferase
MGIHRTRPARHPLAALFAVLLAACLCTMLLKPAPAEEGVPLDVPYVSTPQRVVNKMLDMAGVGQGDVVYDLGCGDGRIVITAARERGATGVGIDLKPQRIGEARGYAKKEGVSDRVKFMVGDLFQANFADATVVTLYLLPQVNRRLRPQLWKQLKAGTRVVSHDFDMGPEWPPEKIEKVGRATLYYWTVTEANKKAVAP